eukprot:COSAG01_NODE_60336_length_295_cov_0.964286_1_plen_40_part_01
MYVAVACKVVSGLVFLRWSSIESAREILDREDERKSEKQ